MKNHATKNAAQSLATLNKYCNLKTPKMGKNWHFIFLKVDTLKHILLILQGHKNNTQIKLLSSKSNENKIEKINTTGLSPVDLFLYSHIARLFTLLLQ
jgi:hypothetical protein